MSRQVCILFFNRLDVKNNSTIITKGENYEFNQRQGLQFYERNRSFDR